MANDKIVTKFVLRFNYIETFYSFIQMRHDVYLTKQV